MKNVYSLAIKQKHDHLKCFPPSLLTALSTVTRHQGLLCKVQVSPCCSHLTLTTLAALALTLVPPLEIRII